jgi:hypothetical protein
LALELVGQGIADLLPFDDEAVLPERGRWCIE